MDLSKVVFEDLVFADQLLAQVLEALCHHRLEFVVSIHQHHDGGLVLKLVRELEAVLIADILLGLVFLDLLLEVLDLLVFLPELVLKLRLPVYDFQIILLSFLCFALKLPSFLIKVLFHQLHLLLELVALVLQGPNLVELLLDILLVAARFVLQALDSVKLLLSVLDIPLPLLQERKYGLHRLLDAFARLVK